MRFLFKICFLAVTVSFVGCELPTYSSPQENAIAIHTILDPEEAIAVYYWFLQGINTEGKDLTKSLVEINVYENELLIQRDTTSRGFIEFDFKPQVGATYLFEVLTLGAPDLFFRTSSYQILPTLTVESVFANDSIAPICEKCTQVYQQIQIQIDTSDLSYPYFAYEITSDSSALFGGESDTILQTENWPPKLGTDCPEIAEAVFFEGEFKIINLLCQENKGLLNFEASDFRPDEFDYMDFKICSVDQKSLDAIRQATQDGFYQSLKDTEQILSIFITKDDFPKTESTYELIINRACTTYKVKI